MTTLRPSQIEMLKVVQSCEELGHGATEFLHTQGYLSLSYPQLKRAQYRLTSKGRSELSGGGER